MKRQQKLWKNLYETLKPPTEICKTCLKEVNHKTLYQFIHRNSVLCADCAKKFIPKFKKRKIGKTSVTYIYNYDETIRTYIYQFKGCYDYELYPVFLYRYKRYLKRKYRDYVIIPVPSYSGDDEKRGFNHVITIFSIIGLKIMPILMKTEHHKQTESKRSERSEISKYMKVKEKVSLVGKKVLLVDDVCTTGNTIKSALNLIKDMKPDKIKVLVISSSLNYV